MGPSCTQNLVSIGLFPMWAQKNGYFSSSLFKYSVWQHLISASLFKKKEKSDSQLVCISRLWYNSTERGWTGALAEHEWKTVFASLVYAFAGSFFSRTFSLMWVWWNTSGEVNPNSMCSLEKTAYVNWASSGEKTLNIDAWMHQGKMYWDTLVY